MWIALLYVYRIHSILHRSTFVVNKASWHILSTHDLLLHIPDPTKESVKSASAYRALFLNEVLS